MKTNHEIPALPFTLTNDAEFNEKCLEVFHYQYTANAVYQNYVSALGLDINAITHYTKIPFLPIQFFKTHDVICGENNTKKVFKSSGTGGDRSRHLVKELSVYEQSFIQCFEEFFGSLEEYSIIALLPNYLDQGDSSLVYMVDKLIQLSGDTNSGFYIDKTEDLLAFIQNIEKQKKVLLIGVTYALLDLAEHNMCKLSNTTIIETGGMKGRRKELIREELHTILKSSFDVNHIYSEYGMTELLSQGYLMENKRFNTPSWMKVLIRDVNDPLSLKETGRGGINIIDLANINSCSFIATQDLGRLYEDNTFKVLGRFDNSDVRGCNLLVV